MEILLIDADCIGPYQAYPIGTSQGYYSIVQIFGHSVLSVAHQNTSSVTRLTQYVRESLVPRRIVKLHNHE